MTGPEHYREAERLLESAADAANVQALDAERWAFAAAQVHATLALAAATADPYGPEQRWLEVTT